MALIGQIRKNSWLLIVLIGGALAAFVIMDMFGSAGSGALGSPTTVGSVNGQDIDIREFTQAEKIQQFLYGSSPNDAGYGRRNIIWDYFVEDAIVQEMADELGLTVSRDELMDLQFGANPSPIIASRFRDPNTQQIDYQRLNQFKQALSDGTLSQDPNWGPVWKYQQEEIIKERLQSKINTMVAKGLYTPTWMVEQVAADQNQRVDFNFVKIPFDEAENAPEPTDADFKNYLNEHQAEFYNEEETRKVQYVVFDVIPTKADSLKVKEKIVNLIPEFKKTQNDSTFISINNGFIDETYFKQEDIASAMSQNIVDSLFQLAIGTVVGPYEDGGDYRAIKILDRKVIPDSVDSRHILRRADPNDFNTYAQANKTIDSLKALLDAGTHEWDSLAPKYSQDYSNAATGGDLGYSPVNRMVKPFNDLIFFKGEEGKVYKVQTQFGVHLVEILDKKFETNEEGVKLAYIREPIVPSVETQDKVKEQARNFIRNNKNLADLRKSATEKDLQLETSTNLDRNAYIVGDLGSDQDSRNIVKWAFTGKTSVGDISPTVYSFRDPINFYDNKYVVVGLQSIIPPGLPKVADIKEQIELQVINQLKAKYIINQISSEDLSTIASKFNTEVDTARGVSFAALSSGNLVNEPKVIAAAFNLDENQTSKPIIGNNGVYVVQLINKSEPGTPANIPQIRQAENSRSQSQVRNKLMQAMKKNANIEDFRSKFY